MLVDDAALRLRLQAAEEAVAGGAAICVPDRKTMVRLVDRLVAKDLMRLHCADVAQVAGGQRAVRLLVHPAEPTDSPAIAATLASLASTLGAARPVRPSFPRTSIPVVARLETPVVRLETTPRPARPVAEPAKRARAGQYGFVQGKMLRAKLLHMHVVRATHVRADDRLPTLHGANLK